MTEPDKLAKIIVITALGVMQFLCLMGHENMIDFFMKVFFMKVAEFPKRNYLEDDELYVIEKYLEWSKGDYILIIFLAVLSVFMMIDFFDSPYFYMGVALFAGDFFFGSYKFIKYCRFKKKAEILRVMES